MEVGDEEDDREYMSMWKLEQQEEREKVNQLVHDSEFLSASRFSSDAMINPHLTF